jgi:taurine transport system substrate-binding protein
LEKNRVIIHLPNVAQAPALNTATHGMAFCLVSEGRFVDWSMARFSAVTLSQHVINPFWRYQMKQLSLVSKFLAAAVAGSLSISAFAQAKKEVTFAYQDMMVPFRAVMETGELEKATGYKVNWKMFGGGGDVIRAMASGDVHIGEVGSSPMAAAASQGQDIQLFWILDDISDAEALIVRKAANITDIKGLKGKKVATPFVSTSHYQLMLALKMAGLGNNDVTVMNMRPPEIAAAWERGDIDGAFIWDPVLSKIKGNGSVLTTSGEIGRKGFPTFDGLAVNAGWAKEHKAFMVTLVKLLAKADADYRSNKSNWLTAANVKAVAKWTKAEEKDVAPSMGLYKFPSLDEQNGAAWLGGGAAKALTDTAVFLKEQGRIQAVSPDYKKFVNAEYVKAAGAK